jgi:Protein of unknown function (DUF3995)
MSGAVISVRVASVGLLAITGVHIAWAAGSSWPLGDRAELARAVIGRREVPPPAACLAVAGLLGVAAALVSGRPRRSPWLRRTGAVAVVATLGARGTLGLAGRTDLVSPGSTSTRLGSLDRRVYSPLCLTLAGLALAAAAR